MWIHILIFIFYCVLFIYSKGFFSKAGNVLSGRLPDFLQITQKQMEMCLRVIFLGNVLGCLISFVGFLNTDSIRDGYLVRNKKGEASYEESLMVSDGKHTQEIEIVVDAMSYTEEELEQFLDDAFTSMDQRILGRNKSFTHVEYPLNLVTEIEDSPVLVDWMTDQPMMLDWEGSIGQDVPDEGVKVLIRGELSAGDRIRFYERQVMVYPEKLPEKESLLRDIQNELKQSALQSEEIQPLPKEVNGKRLVWHKPYAKDGWLITALGVLMGVLLILKEHNQKKEELKKRELLLRADYPLLLNKIILYMRAGVSCRMAIGRIVTEYQEQLKLIRNDACIEKKMIKKDGAKQNSDLSEVLYHSQIWYYKKHKEQNMESACRPAYEELSHMYYEMEQGISEQQAYERFASRCGLLEYRTLSNLLTQNLKKGSSQFFEALEAECRQAFEERKRRALVAGEEAGTKLLLPMVLMLVVVLMIIMVPVFMRF